MMSLRPVLAALTVSALLATASHAEPIKDQATFDLVMRGITAGTLSFSANQEGEGYAVVGRLASSGILAMIRKVSYDARSQGRIADGRYIPSSYKEKADTGKRQSESVIEYEGGVPQVRVYNPPREPAPFDVDASTQGGSVDPLTALYATLRDAAPGQECNRTVRMFDGRRASQLALGKPQAGEDGTITCPGEYRRLAGFSPEDMAEKTRFPFTLTYAPTETGVMRVTEVAMESLYGKARLVRR